MRSVVLSISLLLLNGCIGISVGTFGKMETEGFTPFLGESIASVKGRVGDPKSEYEYFDCNVLEYEADGLVWSGVYVYLLVIPLPLAVPISKSDFYYFKDDELIGFSVSSTGEKSNYGYFCSELKCGFLTGPQDMQTQEKIDPKKHIGDLCG